MLKKKNSPTSMDTVIGEYTTFVGNVDSEGSLQSETLMYLRRAVTSLRL